MRGDLAAFTIPFLDQGIDSSDKLVLSKGCRELLLAYLLKKIVDLRIYPLSWFHPKNKPFVIKGT